MYLVSTLIVGVLSQAMANEPDLEWGQGRFTSTFPKLMKLFATCGTSPFPPLDRSGPAEIADLIADGQILIRSTDDLWIHDARTKE